jgi:excisionase family DNA binding protein
MVNASDNERGPAPVSKILLTAEEAAEAMSLGRSFVYELVMCKRIRSVKVGRKRRIPVFALHEFVSRQLAEMDEGA